jgi:UDP-N-acetylmuramyl pentapeptide phosphotransferase/UDP-N-acetylglucosamine-1-phosphate transferase
MFYYLLFPLLALVVNLIIKRNKILLNNVQLSHQKLTNIHVPSVGGYFLIIPIIVFFYKDNIFFSTISIFIFLLGVFSDLNILSSPKKRFFIQLLLVLVFVFLKKIEVLPTRIDYLDTIFLNTYWSYFFTVFCLMILINGSNFIDGLNGLLLGYLLIILFIIYKLNLFNHLNISTNQIIFLIYIFFIILIFNLSNQFFLGDSGAYFLSFFTGFILIEIYSMHKELSPYFIILLLWYPCFENLFSILRKLIKKRSVLKPDNEHLHQLIFILIKNKFTSHNLFANILSGFLINFFNFILLYWGSTNPYSTKFQLSLFLVAIFFYVIIYLIIKIYLKNLIISLKE